MKLLKQIIATFLILISVGLLTGCGGSDSPAESLRSYEGGDFTINIPPEWKIINQSDFYPEIPKETVVAFTTPETYDGFFVNVNVVRESLSQAVGNVDYARANINLASQTLTDYEKVQEATIKIGDKETLVHIFQARLNPAEKRLRLVQLYATQGNYGYIVTGGMLPDTPKEIRDTVGAVVTSFRLR